MVVPGPFLAGFVFGLALGLAAFLAFFAGPLGVLLGRE